jgi:CRISPR-associated protein Csm4
MDTLTLRLTPQAAFGTPLLGDTLFGQLCWAVCNRFGEERLRELLAGYLDGRPFAVISDALPAGHVPRPAVPLARLGKVDANARKAAKKRRWLPLGALSDPERWLDAAVELWDSDGRKSLHPQPHNAINRSTGTTGRGGFAPYVQVQRWYPTDAVLDCHIVHDAPRITASELVQLFQDIGMTGFGRDATVGLGRFAAALVASKLPGPPATANAWLTLAPCAPQGQGFDPRRSYYHVFTRCGRHGDIGVHRGHPFKTPVLLAAAGAVLTPAALRPMPFVGRGLGGDGRLSRSIPETVHQGYAPVLGIELPRREETA